METKQINNFSEYGFTADFEGEILKEVDGKYVGYVKSRQLRIVYGVVWFKDGECSDMGYNLTPIKKEWYDVPTNYPAMLIRDTEEHLGYRWVDNKEDFIKSHRQGFRIITKAERDKLFVAEDLI